MKQIYLIQRYDYFRNLPISDDANPSIIGATLTQNVAYSLINKMQRECVMAMKVDFPISKKVIKVEGESFSSSIMHNKSDLEKIKEYNKNILNCIETDTNLKNEIEIMPLDAPFNGVRNRTNDLACFYTFLPINILDDENSEIISNILNMSEEEVAKLWRNDIEGVGGNNE